MIDSIYKQDKLIHITHFYLFALFFIQKQSFYSKRKNRQCQQREMGQVRRI
ncbi:MAG: hypothetical protein UZ11_BCD004001978 [Bacteroidetes bacterium OLB11]|nr:MAG: hypothetical protein UZ11_BCD004001978 [Bacteroidetes bacterium OLB11]